MFIDISELVFVSLLIVLVLGGSPKADDGQDQIPLGQQATRALSALARGIRRLVRR